MLNNEQKTAKSYRLIFDGERGSRLTSACELLFRSATGESLMIVDHIEYTAEYGDKLAHLADALARIKQNPGIGKHAFPGGYLMRQEGQTKSVREGFYEAHRSYIDVQLFTEGREILRWNRLENMTEIAPYDSQTDKQTLQGQGAVLEIQQTDS